MSDVKISGYKVISLIDMINNLEEEKINEILHSFSCPLNEDVETFLRSKAVLFDKQSISRTKLVFTSFKNQVVLVGYFTLAYKDFTIPQRILSRKLRDRIKKFGSYNDDIKAYKISAPLIAQLGKNYANGYNKLITGDELLAIACRCVREVQLNIGGKIVYVECEDKARLLNFYESNGFVAFSCRQLDKDDAKVLNENYLVQLLRYLD